MKKNPSRIGESFSFQNPFAQQTTNNNSPQISITHNTENITNHRCSRLTNRQIKYLSIILSFIILTIIAITLAVYYTRSKKESFTTGEFDFTCYVSVFRKPKSNSKKTTRKQFDTLSETNRQKEI